MHKPSPRQPRQEAERNIIRHNSIKTTAIACVDDITIIVTQPEEIDTIKETLHGYMQATSARINVNKSRAIALGSWNKLTPLMDLNFYEDFTLLGFNMTRIYSNPLIKLGRC